MMTAPCTTTLPAAAPSRAEIQAQLRALAPELLQDGSRYLTALAYLASLSRPSIDRIAWLLGCDREFVARRARRWADSGVWNTPSQSDHELTAKRLAEIVDIGEGLSSIARAEPDDAPAAGGPSTDAVDGDALLGALWRGLGIATPDDWDRLVA